MCGIAGIFDASQAADPRAVQVMVDVLEHRGPDGQGVWTADAVALGHRRLSIIDLSDAGAQPMHSHCGQYVITYNGEIYNYIELRRELEQAGRKFGSATDTEVILNAYAEWGTDCLHRFNGMFAFALYDTSSRELFCARDRLGVKPLSYTWNGERFAFASESKALLQAGLARAEPNSDAIYEYLARGYTSGGRSFYADIESLQPGHSLRITSEGLRISQWWSPPTEIDDSRSLDEWTQQIAELLDDAVRLRLRSDVPVGAHLSGGLDSSAVVAAAARHGGAEVHTFTGAFAGDPASDERRYSRAVNERYGLHAHEVEISVDELPAQFRRLLWHMDEPIAGPGVFPQLLVCDLARAHGFTVVLGGQGGDELFGGYLRHRALHYKLQMREGGPAARLAAAFELFRLASGEWRRVMRTATRVADDQLASSFLASVDSDFREQVRRSHMSFGSARESMRWDLLNYLPALLHVEDRTSMAASIESRTPLLDYRLVECAMSIPERLLFKRGEPKPLLRQAVADWLPPAVATRRDKKGFPTPLHQWRQRPQLAELVHALTTPAAAAHEVGGAEWHVSGDAAAGHTVFSDSYLERSRSFQPSELWTVMTVQGWLSQLQSGARPDFALH